MNANRIRLEWAKYLKFFTDQNIGRPTRLGVFERTGDSVIDYWIESGLPFKGVDLDASGDSRSLQILIGNMGHVVNEPQQFKLVLTLAGDEDGIDITDADGRITVLRFEVPRTD